MQPGQLRPVRQYPGANAETELRLQPAGRNWMPESTCEEYRRLPHPVLNIYILVTAGRQLTRAAHAYCPSASPFRKDPLLHCGLSAVGHGQVGLLRRRRAGDSPLRTYHHPRHEKALRRAVCYPVISKSGSSVTRAAGLVTPRFTLSAIYAARRVALWKMAETGSAAH